MWESWFKGSNVGQHWNQSSSIGMKKCHRNGKTRERGRERERNEMQRKRRKRRYPINVGDRDGRIFFFPSFFFQHFSPFSFLFPLLSLTLLSIKLYSKRIAMSGKREQIIFDQKWLEWKWLKGKRREKKKEERKRKERDVIWEQMATSSDTINRIRSDSSSLSFPTLFRLLFLPYISSTQLPSLPAVEFSVVKLTQHDPEPTDDRDERKEEERVRKEEREKTSGRGEKKMVVCVGCLSNYGVSWWVVWMIWFIRSPILNSFFFPIFFQLDSDRSSLLPTPSFFILSFHFLSFWSFWPTVLKNLDMKERER